MAKAGPSEPNPVSVSLAMPRRFARKRRSHASDAPSLGHGTHEAAAATAACGSRNSNMTTNNTNDDDDDESGTLDLRQYGFNQQQYPFSDSSNSYSGGGGGGGGDSEEPNYHSMDYYSSPSSSSSRLSPPVIDVSGLRSPRMQAAPATTSLDRIRAELSAMRAEAREREQAAADRRFLEAQQEQLRRAQVLEGRRDPLHTPPSARPPQPPPGAEDSDALDEMLRRQRLPHAKPSDAYYASEDVRARLREREAWVAHRLYQQADEVLRLRNRDHTLRYLRLAMPQYFAHGSGGDGVRALAGRLLAAVEKERAALLAEATGAGEQHQEDGGEAAVPEGLRELAWLTVLESLSQKEMKLLIDSGVVDLALLEALLTPPTDSTAKEEEDDDDGASGDGDGARPDAESAAVESKSGGAGATSDGAESEPVPAAAVLVLEERLRALHDVEYAAELTREITDTTLRGTAAHSLDLAPVLAKVREGLYDEITQEELRLLEAHEEKALLQLTSSLPGGDTASGEEKDKDKGKGKEKDVAAATLPLTPALLDAAVLPTNAFLHAVAKMDPALRESLDILERTKRHSLLDAEFQAALRAAHRTEEVAVQAYVRGGGRRTGGQTSSAGAIKTPVGALFGAPPEQRGDKEDGAGDGTRNDSNSEGEEEGRVSARQQRLLQTSRLQRREQRLRGRAARPAHAADIPFFYSSPMSVVPPKGRFNLPAPALSKQERAAMRGARRRRMRRRNGPFSQ